MEERYQGLLTDAEGFLLPPDLNRDAMTKGELRTLCRSRRLRGWSTLRRDELLAFVKDKLSREIEMSRLLHKESLAEATPAESTADAAGPEPNRPDGSTCPAGTALPDGSACFAEATRSERLLLLLLQHLNVPLQQILAAWQEPDGD